MPEACLPEGRSVDRESDMAGFSMKVPGLVSRYESIPNAKGRSDPLRGPLE
jgi:hypothetical protein